MTRNQTTRTRVFILASTGLAIALASCATATDSITPTKAIPTMSATEKAAMTAECKSMHEAMMANKGDRPSHQMMTPEMKEKHQTCMTLMPEMKAEMKAKCEAHKADGMQHDKMHKEKTGKGMMDRDRMHQMCKMMDQKAVGDGEDQ